MAKNTRFMFLLLTIVATLSHGSLAGTVFELIHKDHINLPETRSELLAQMLRRDDRNDAGTVPLVAGRYNGAVTGHYFAKIKMGTPAQEVLMDIDTGSDITWMNCLYKGKQVKQKATGSIFNADKSMSFREIQCGSPTCRAFHNIDKCRSRQQTCGFNFRYRDVRMHVVLANEIVTLDLKNGKTTQLRDVLVGCSDYSSNMDGATNGASGVLGLSHTKLSLRSKASESFGNKLSYCLLDPLTPINKSSYLIFGSYEGVNIRFDQVMQYTDLVPKVHGSFYGLNIKDACVNGKCNILNMRTKPLVFNSKGNGGVIVDTGTLATLLVEEAYMPIIRAIDAFYGDYKVTHTKQRPFEVCYVKGRNKKFPDAPKLKFVFNDGKEFAPHPESYVIDIDENMTCLGFVNLGKMSLGINSVFGTMLQQRFFWDLDLKNNKLGFASSNCIVGS